MLRWIADKEQVLWASCLFLVYRETTSPLLCFPAGVPVLPCDSALQYCVVLRLGISLLNNFNIHFVAYLNEPISELSPYNQVNYIFHHLNASFHNITKISLLLTCSSLNTVVMSDKTEKKSVWISWHVCYWLWKKLHRLMVYGWRNHMDTQVLYKWFACSGQEQKGDAGWSPEQVLVLSYRHHLITDGGASATGAAIVCQCCADSNHSITGGAGRAAETGTAAFSCCKPATRPQALKFLLLPLMWYRQSSPQQQRSCFTWHSCSKGSFSLATPLSAWESKDFALPSSWEGPVYTQLSLTTVF